MSNIKEAEMVIIEMQQAGGVEDATKVVERLLDRKNGEIAKLREAFEIYEDALVYAKNKGYILEYTDNVFLRLDIRLDLVKMNNAVEEALNKVHSLGIGR